MVCVRERTVYALKIQTFVCSDRMPTQYPGIQSKHGHGSPSMAMGALALAIGYGHRGMAREQSTCLQVLTGMSSMRLGMAKEGCG